jgi:hypothetical protein
MSVPSIGQVAYEAYRDKASGISLVTADRLPPWEVVNSDIQEAWTASANAVLVHDAEQRRAENKSSSLCQRHGRSQQAARVLGPAMAMIHVLSR